MAKKKNPHAVALGQRGGSVKSAKKTAAARRNGLMAALKRKIRKELDTAQAVR